MCLRSVPFKTTNLGQNSDSIPSILTLMVTSGKCDQWNEHGEN